MNKYIIEQDNTGIRVGNFVTSTSTGKIILNGVEITDIDTFNKAVDTFKDLQNKIEEKDKEIERLNKELKLKTDFIEELLTIISVARDYELHDKCYTRSKIYQDKLKELKEKK